MTREQLNQAMLLSTEIDKVHDRLCTLKGTEHNPVYNNPNRFCIPSEMHSRHTREIREYLERRLEELREELDRL